MFAALVVIATTVAVLIGNVMPTHRVQTGSDSTDDMTGTVARASRVAAMTPMSAPKSARLAPVMSDSGGEPSATPGASQASGVSTRAVAASGARADAASSPDTALAGAGVSAEPRGTDAVSGRHLKLHPAVHHPMPASDSARTGGTLRADIARYNAERRAGGHAAVLRAASVPNVHSLWDEIPGPMSDVYRN